MRVADVGYQSGAGVSLTSQRPLRHAGWPPAVPPAGCVMFCETSVNDGVPTIESAPIVPV